MITTCSRSQALRFVQHRRLPVAGTHTLKQGVGCEHDIKGTLARRCISQVLIAVVVEGLVSILILGIAVVIILICEQCQVEARAGKSTINHHHRSAQRRKYYDPDIYGSCCGCKGQVRRAGTASTAVAVGAHLMSQSHHHHPQRHHQA